MAYQSLYRKYRPQTFGDVVGQGHVVRTLQNALATGRIAHGFLFTGTRGTAKTTVARLLAKALNCQSANHPVPEPCNVCASCVAITSGASIDVIEMDAASHRGVADIEEVRKAVGYGPMELRYKVFIIDEAHQLSSDAKDAFLKTLEEPPPQVAFILATTEPQSIPITIRSRCQQFDFKRGSLAEIASRLRYVLDREGVTYTPDAVNLVARGAEGSYRDSLSLLEQVLAFSPKHVTANDVNAVLGSLDADTLVQVVEAVYRRDAPTAFALAGELLDAGKEARTLLRTLSAHFRDLMLVSVGGPAVAQELSPDDVARLQEHACYFTPTQIMRAMDILNEAQGETRWNNQHRLLVELAFLKLMSLGDTPSAPLLTAPIVFATNPLPPVVTTLESPVIVPATVLPTVSVPTVTAPAQTLPASVVPTTPTPKLPVPSVAPLPPPTPPLEATPAEETPSAYDEEVGTDLDGDDEETALAPSFFTSESDDEDEYSPSSDSDDTGTGSGSAVASVPSLDGETQTEDAQDEPDSERQEGPTLWEAMEVPEEAVTFPPVTPPVPPAPVPASQPTLDLSAKRQAVFVDEYAGDEYASDDADAVPGLSSTLETVEPEMPPAFPVTPSRPVPKLPEPAMQASNLPHEELDEPIIPIDAYAPEDVVSTPEPLRVEPLQPEPESPVSFSEDELYRAWGQFRMDAPKLSMKTAMLLSDTVPHLSSRGVEIVFASRANYEMMNTPKAQEFVRKLLARCLGAERVPVYFMLGEDAPPPPPKQTQKKRIQHDPLSALEALNKDAPSPPSQGFGTDGFSPNPFTLPASRSVERPVAPQAGERTVSPFGGITPKVPPPLDAAPPPAGTRAVNGTGQAGGYDYHAPAPAFGRRAPAQTESPEKYAEALADPFVQETLSVFGGELEQE